MTMSKPIEAAIEKIRSHIAAKKNAEELEDIMDALDELHDEAEEASGEMADEAAAKELGL